MSERREPQRSESEAFREAAELLASEMPQLKPASDTIALAMLAKLSRRNFSQVFDVGCSRARQTSMRRFLTT